MIRTVQLPSGSTVYKVRVGRNGPQRTFTRMRDAREFEARSQLDTARVRAGMQPRRQAITYDALCDVFMAGYAGGSEQWTRAMLAHSRKQFGRTLVGALTPEEIARWLNGLQKSDKTKKHILERMRMVLSAGVEWGYLPQSPARPSAVKGPSGKRRDLIQPFESWAEVEAVVEQLRTPHERALVQFLCSTGLRCPSEWQLLRWRDVDFEARSVVVHGTKTEAAARTVPLSQLALDAVSLIEKRQGLVFDRIDYPNWRRTEWRDALAAARLSQRPPYQMRHTFATLALSAGVPLDVVANWLGHTDMSVTRSYYAKYIRPTTERYAALLDNLKGDA